MHELDLLLARVSRNVHLDYRVVKHADSVLGKLVYYSAYELFVTRYSTRGQHDEVVSAESYLRVVAKRHSVKRRHRLALASRGDKSQLLGLKTADLVNIDEHSVGNGHVSELHCGGYDIYHAASRDSDLSSVPCAYVYYLLNAVNVRGERRDNDPLVRVRGEDILKRLADLTLRGSKSRALCVGGLAHEQKHALSAYLAKARDVHHLAVDGCDVKLEVTRVNDNTERRSYRKTAGVCDGVICVNELDCELTEANGLPRLYAVELRRYGKHVLRKLVFNNSERKIRSVYGRIYLAQNVRYRSYVVLVSVGKDHTPYFFLVGFKIRYIGYD